jgi:hypothetical protein
MKSYVEKKLRIAVYMHKQNKGLRSFGARVVCFLKGHFSMLSGYTNQLRRRVGQDFRALSNPLSLLIYSLLFEPKLFIKS